MHLKFAILRYQYPYLLDTSKSIYKIRMIQAIQSAGFRFTEFKKCQPLTFVAKRSVAMVLRLLEKYSFTSSYQNIAKIVAVYCIP